MRTFSLNQVITRFGVEPEENVETWMRKIRLVADLRSIDDLAKLLPLFLDESAFAVYEQLSEPDKLDINAIESALVTTFSIDNFEAYSKFEARVRRHWESVDVFLSDLRRLAGLAGIDPEKILRLAFAVGLPHFVSVQLRARHDIKALPLDYVVHTVRTLMSKNIKEEREGLKERRVSGDFNMFVDDEVDIAAVSQKVKGKSRGFFFTVEGPIFVAGALSEGVISVEDFPLTRETVKLPQPFIMKEVEKVVLQRQK